MFCLFIDFFFIILGRPQEVTQKILAEKFVRVGLDLAEILRISKLDWRDGGGGKKGRRGGGEESYFVMV